MSGVEEALLGAARLEADDDVLVLGGSSLAFGAQSRLASGWVYVVRREVDDLEELLREAHSTGATGLAYLVGEPPVLPLPDGAVAAAVGSLGAADVSAAAAELARVLVAGGHVALAETERTSADALAAALESAGFRDVALAELGDGVVVSGTRA
jgi:hypothetical protein